jgi:zinc protease
LLFRQILESGLDLVVEPRNALPIVACQLRIAAGAADEVPGEIGASHFVEHMLFKGTERLGVGELARRFDALGGDINAYTTHDETVVYFAVPAEGFFEALDLLAEMSFGPRLAKGARASNVATGPGVHFDPQEVERERRVILDEIRGGLDEPERVLGEALAHRCWTVHPYGRPVIGTTEGVAALTTEAIAAFHDRFYTASNASLVVVGATDPNEVASVADRLFGGSSVRAEKPVRPVEPPQPDLRIVRVNRDFSQQLVEVAFRVPGHRHPDLPAIDLLVSALGEGQGAVLPGHLKLELGLALSAWADCEVGSDGGTFIAGFAPAEGALDDAVRALGTRLRDVSEHGVPLDAFQRARTAILADRIYQGETVEGRAATLSWYTGTFGDPEAEATYRGRIQALKPVDVAEVARRYLRLERSTVALLGPDTDLSWEEVAELLMPRRSPRPFLPGRIQRRAHRVPWSPRVHRFTLGNGLTVLVEPDPAAGTTALRIEGVGGSLVEKPESAGHTRAWADLLMEGAGEYDAVSFARAVEALAGSFLAGSGRSTFGISAEFPSDLFMVGLPLALLPLTSPRFDADAVEREREALEEDLRTRADDPGSVAVDALWALLWPGHTYRLPPTGTPGSLRRLSAGGLRALHSRLIHPANLVLAVAGAVDPNQVRDDVQRLLPSLGSGSYSLPPRRSGPLLRHNRDITGEWEESQVFLGFRGCSFRDEERWPLEVLATILGGQGGRLFIELREQAALCYGVSATNVEAWDPGAFICSMGTSPEKIDEAKEALDAVIQGLHDHPPDEAEVARARAVLYGATLFDLQRVSLRSTEIAQDERFGLDGTRYRENLRKVERTTAQDVRRVIAEWLVPERSAAVVVRR